MQLYTKYIEKNKIVSDIDKDIRNYIRQNQQENYEHILQEDDRWQVFFHLSRVRESLFSWYEFNKNAELLEIGGGFGALTGLFCESCRHVTTTEQSLFRAEAICERYADKANLDVYAGSLEKIVLDKKFNYIVLVGLLERITAGSSKKQGYVKYLESLRKLLKPEGKILIAVENRYGIRYFCGAAEPHTGRAFDGINRYPRGTNGYSFSKQELKDILNLSGLSSQKFYYPLPDYKLPQLIYSDEHLPERNIRERLIPYYVKQDTLLASENDIYDDLVANQVFPFFANSFLVECSPNNNAFCSVTYAAVSADRGREKSFATTIHQNDIVKKHPLYPEGEINAQNLYNNTLDLQAHGIPVIEHHWENKTLVMPYVKGDTLSNHLKKLIREDANAVFAILDQLYDYILASSKAVEAAKNALCRDGQENLDWGIVLQRAYMELIPLNCFYIDGNFLFFDQEFVRENYPAKYVLYRAIHYLYVFAPDAEEFLPIAVLKARYGLTKTWDLFQLEEDHFLKMIRKQDVYRHFYRWAGIDIDLMHKKADLLASSNEIIMGYKLTEKMKRIWRVELDLTKQFKSVCEKYQLRYYMICGTLLGAVRHKGFIPWDDDVDFAMPRADFERLKLIAAEEFAEPYFFQSPENDPNCFYGGLCRLRNSNTTGILQMDIGNASNQGIWIDILPLDICIEDEEKLEKQRKLIEWYQSLLHAKVYGKELSRYDWKWKFRYFIAKFWSHRKLCKKLQNAFTMYNKEVSTKVATFTGYRQFDKIDFSDTILLEFAGMYLPAPKEYEHCLEMSMGKNYMTYPPVKRRMPHHTGIFNPDMPYKKYNELFFGIFEDIGDKKIVLFGGGQMFEDYMDKYGAKYRPDFLVDNDKSKWGTKRQGIVIKNPEELTAIPQEKMRLIICSFYYRQIEKQLQDMGIGSYRIYIQEKQWIVEDEAEGRE